MPILGSGPLCPATIQTALETGRPAGHIGIMAQKHPKRPRDLNQWAKRMVDIATGQAEDREPTPEEQGKDPAAVERGKRGGAKGGKVRAATLSPQARREAARKAAQARWSRS